MRMKHITMQLGKANSNQRYLRCIKDWMNTKNTFHVISREGKMVLVFDVNRDIRALLNGAGRHTHCPTQSHAHMLYFRLSLSWVPRFSEGVADLEKVRTCIKALHWRTNYSTCCYEWSVGGLAVQ